MDINTVKATALAFAVCAIVLSTFLLSSFFFGFPFEGREGKPFAAVSGLIGYGSAWFVFGRWYR